VYAYGDTVYALDDIRGTAVFTIDGRLIRQVLYPSLHPETHRGANICSASIGTMAVWNA
jgi:hypothetical protein